MLEINLDIILEYDLELSRLLEILSTLGRVDLVDQHLDWYDTNLVLEIVFS